MCPKTSVFLMVLLVEVALAYTGEEGIEATACAREDYKETMTGLPNNFYFGLYRYIPNEVGEERNITIENKTYTMITRALRPPIFEIPNFLTDSECDKIISIADGKGMSISPLFGVSQWEIMKKIYFANDVRDVIRLSFQAWVPMADAPGEERVLSKIQDRLAVLTKIPKRFIQTSEKMQVIKDFVTGATCGRGNAYPSGVPDFTLVVKYLKGNHYHAHHDSTDFSLYWNKNFTRKQFDKMPCCQNSNCGGKEFGCCVMCRYATVMYYLSDVEKGGETAFIRAQVHKSKKKNRYSTLYNLSHYCRYASVRIKPKKGTAIFWYNNVIDQKTGWIGETDLFSCHGGCDVIKGVKWIGNNWINVPKYGDRHYKSVYSHTYKPNPSFWSKMLKSETYVNPMLKVAGNVYNTVRNIHNALTGK